MRTGTTDSIDMFAIRYHWLAMCWIMSSLLSLHSALAEDYIKMHCSKSKNFKVLETCCGDGSFSAGIKKAPECSQHEDDSCYYNCLYNHWHLLSANRSLNLENARSMIMSIYKDNSQYTFSKKLMNAYEECALASKNGLFFALFMSDEIASQCPPEAHYYAECVTISTFLNCPSQSWHSNTKCEIAKNDLALCIQMLRNLADLGEIESRTSGALSRQRRDSKSTSHWYVTFFNWLVF